MCYILIKRKYTYEGLKICMQQDMGISLGDISLKNNESPLLSNHKLASIDSQLGLGLPHQFPLHALRFL